MLERLPPEMLAHKSSMTTHSIEPEAFRFERILTVGPESIDAYRVLRLRGLREHPESFGETPESFEAKSNQQIVERVEAQKRLGGVILAASSSAGELIGTVGLAINEAEKSRHRGMLWGMYVVPEARNQGVARALIDELWVCAERINELEQIHLAVVTTNQSAYRLYQSMGFSTYGTDPKVLKIGGQAFDEYLMVKFLPRATIG